MRFRSIHWLRHTRPMNRSIIILLTAAAIAIAGYALYFNSVTAPAKAMLREPAGELAWLRQEFRLSDAQFQRIATMHGDYAPLCAAMCSKIARSNERLDALISANNTPTPEVRAALHECAVVQEECRQAMLGHIYAVSREMSPEQGTRYLKMMKSRLVEAGMHADTVVSK